MRALPKEIRLHIRSDLDIDLQDNRAKRALIQIWKGANVVYRAKSCSCKQECAVRKELMSTKTFEE
jgi:hypothetical protein